MSINIDINDAIAQRIEREVGISVPRGVNSFSIDRFFKNEKIEDVLDAITVVYEGLEETTPRRGAHRRHGEEFRVFVNQVFKEEGIAYLMSADGSVNFNPDEEFEANRTLTLGALAEPQFNAALTAFNNAYSAFHSEPPNYKSALKDIFEANESIFKNITKEERLTKHCIVKSKSTLSTLAKNPDPTSSKAFDSILNSYIGWVDAMHNYRHAGGGTVYDNPTLEFTTLALSNGSAYLRWLVSIAKSMP